MERILTRGPLTLAAAATAPCFVGSAPNESAANLQPQRPRISYYAEPDLLPLTLPIIIAMSALGFAVFGAGVYADRWRKLISDTFGPGMLPGAKWFFVFMVRSFRMAGDAASLGAPGYMAGGREVRWRGKGAAVHNGGVPARMAGGQGNEQGEAPTQGDIRGWAGAKGMMTDRRGDC